MKEIGIALVGAGEIAQNFHLPILTKLDSVKILAICDLNKSLASALADKYEIPFVAKNVDEILEIDGLKAVDICASTDAHLEIAKACITSGKHVLIEKPVARSYDEAAEIKKAAEEHRVKAMVGMNQRFRSDAIMLKNYIARGEIGEVFYVKAGWLQQKRHKSWIDRAEKSGGGVLLDLGVTIIDSLLWIYDFQPVTSVQASIFHHMTTSVEDVCVGSLRFENGSVATFEISWTLFSAKTRFFCDVYGSRGSIQVNPFLLYRSSGDKFSPVPSTYMQNDLTILKKSFESELKHFINAVLDYTPVISTLDEAARRMEIIEALYQSARIGREVKLN